MLSIGAMSAGQENYYLGLAREDYYLEGGEPQGVWHGKGAAEMGLVGDVESRDMRMLFAGYSVDGERALTQRQRHEGKADHRPGWDLTFSAPKSVSVFWSQSSPETREQIQKAHFEAVKASLDYLENTAGQTRRGQGGKRIEQAGLVIATFEHGTSRAMDPQLHTHALVLNVAVRSDGTTGAVSSKSIFDCKMAAGALYRAHLASELERTLGLEVVRSPEAVEILGVPRRMSLEFSKRREEIKNQIDAQGIVSAKGAAAVALQTRHAKESVPREQLFATWRESGRTLGWSEEQAEQLLGRAPKSQPVTRMVIDPEQLSSRSGYFHEREAIREAATQAHSRDAREIQKEVREFLSRSPEVISLGNSRFTTPAVRRPEGWQSFELFAPPAPGTLQEAKADQPINFKAIGRFAATEKARGSRVLGVAADKKAAVDFERKTRIETVTADELLGDLSSSKSAIKKALHDFKNQKDLPELIASKLPNIETWLEKYTDKLDRVMGKDLRQLTNSVLRKHGPDIGQLFRFIESKLPNNQPLWRSRVTLVIHGKEKIPPAKLVQIIREAEIRGTTLKLTQSQVSDRVLSRMEGIRESARFHKNQPREETKDRGRMR